MAGIIVDIGARVSKLNKGLAKARKSIGMFALNIAASMAKAGWTAAVNFTRFFGRQFRRAGLIAGGLLAAGIGKSVAEAGRFEGYQFQFEALMGSAEKAKARMAELEEVDLRVPFDITQLANASRVLEVFTAGAFAGADALTMMADAASVTPRPLEEIAYWYGRAYSMIKANRPLGEAVMRLTEMGLVSAEASIALQRLSKSYSPRAQARKMAIINAEFMKFEGSAAKMATTWGGVVSIFGSGTRLAFKTVGDAILPLAKVWLQEVIDKIAELRKNGTLTRWGQNISNAAQWARKAIETLYKRTQEYVAYLQNRAKTITIFEIFAEEFSKALSFVGTRLDGFYQENKATFAKIGQELGNAIAIGIMEALKAGLTGAGRLLLLGGERAVTGGQYGSDKLRAPFDESVRGKYYEPGMLEGIRALREAERIRKELGMSRAKAPLTNAWQVQEFLRQHGGADGSSGNPLHVVIDNTQGGM